MKLGYDHRFFVLGLGESGRAAARFLLKQGSPVVGVDARADILVTDPQIEQLMAEGMYLLNDDPCPSTVGFDAVIVSPGVSPKHPLCKQARQNGLEVIGEIELACRHLYHESHAAKFLFQPARGIQRRVIGITGTNGKTTVTLLVTHVLNTCGIPARSVGNIGDPLIAAVEDTTNEVLVVELSSWQLETMTSKVFSAGVVLNITPDHLDRHETMEKYARAKFALGHCLRDEGTWFVYDATARDYADILRDFPAHSTYGYSSNADLHCDTNGVYAAQKLEYFLPDMYRGMLSHDVENEMAAYTLCRPFGVTGAQFRSAAQTFKKPPHRNELVRIRRGVGYYNDSKGTNIDAVIKAIASVQGTCILIAGGKDKGNAYTPWLEAFENRVRLICAIGEAAPQIKEQLSHRVPVEIFPSLKDAVERAAAEAKRDENVLLSPGCSSYDMFENYAHRGKEFTMCVNQLPE